MIPFMILTGASNGFSLTLYGATGSESYGVRHLGAIRAAVAMIVLFAAATGPGLAGVMFDRGVGFGQAILLLAGFCATASLVLRPFCAESGAFALGCGLTLRQASRGLPRA